MDYIELLFIRTVDELSQRINSNDAYEILQASGLIRKLFLDENPIVEVVNRKYKEKLEFIICDFGTFEIPGVPKPDMWNEIDSLNPDTGLGLPVISVSRDKFFKKQIGYYEGKFYTVKDVVKYVSNIMGGVHFDTPSNEVEIALEKIKNFILFGDLNTPLRSLRAIGRIVLKSLNPLKDKVSKLN